MTGLTTDSYRRGDVTARTTINGVEWTARIEQFETTAYISIWGGGTDHDADITTDDVRRELALAIRGECELHPQTVAVLRLVANVFARAERAGGPSLADAEFIPVIHDRHD